MHNYKKLRIGELAMTMVKSTYTLCTQPPESEKYILGRELKRTAISIASNIAEGTGYSPDAQFVRYLNIAMGSSCELNTQIIIAQEIYNAHLSDALIKSINSDIDEWQKNDKNPY